MHNLENDENITKKIKELGRRDFKASIAEERKRNYRDNANRSMVNSDMSGSGSDEDDSDDVSDSDYEGGSDIEIEGMTKYQQEEQKNSLFINVYAIPEEDLSELYIKTLNGYYNNLGLKTLMIFFNSALTDELLTRLLKQEDDCHRMAKFVCKICNATQETDKKSAESGQADEYDSVIRKIISTSTNLKKQ